MFDYVESGRRLKIFNIADEYSNISPGVLVGYSIKGSDIVHFLNPVSQEQPLKTIHVDQGTEFTSSALLNWSYRKGIEIQLEFVKEYGTHVNEGAYRDSRKMPYRVLGQPPLGGGFIGDPTLMIV